MSKNVEEKKKEKRSYSRSLIFPERKEETISEMFQFNAVV